MILNLDTEKITFENYKEILYKIDEFKREAFDIYRSIPREHIDNIIYSKRKNPIEGIEICKKFKIEEKILFSIFREGIGKMNFTSTGEYRIRGCKETSYENEVFMLRPSPYDETSCNCGLTHDEYNSNYIGYSNDIDDLGAFHAIKCYSSSEQVVNFWFKPTNLKISWRMFFHQDSYSNQEIDIVYLDAVLDFCRRSMYSEEELPTWIG